MHELESERETLAQDEGKLKVLFKEMLQICLWGNATVRRVPTCLMILMTLPSRTFHF